MGAEEHEATVVVGSSHQKVEESRLAGSVEVEGDMEILDRNQDVGSHHQDEGFLNRFRSHLRQRISICLLARRLLTTCPLAPHQLIGRSQVDLMRC